MTRDRLGVNGTEPRNRPNDGTAAIGPMGGAGTSPHMRRGPSWTAPDAGTDRVDGTATRTRAAVHAASGHRLGAAAPHQEGPADLRLVPLALAGWGAAALALSVSGRTAAIGSGTCCLAALMLLALTRAHHGSTGRVRPLPDHAAPGTTPPDHLAPDGATRHHTMPEQAAPGQAAPIHTALPHAAPDHTSLGWQPVPGRTAPVHMASDRTANDAAMRGCAGLWPWGRTVTGRAASGLPDQAAPDRAAPAASPVVPRSPWARRPSATVAVAAALLCAAAAGVSAALHAADPRRGPLPELAEQHARATVELTLTDDPYRTRPQVRGAQQMPGVIVLRADATRISTPRYGTATTRTPVLAIVRSERRVDWLRLLPSTRLRVQAQLAPPVDPGPAGVRDVAAVLRVRGDGPPPVVSPPSAPQRIAGRLRAGLREATDGLPPDARALLPGLVIGDTSRVPPDLDAAFRATDLSHLLSVSGANLNIVLMLLIGPPGIATLAERRGLAPRLGIPLRTTAILAALLILAFVVVCRPDPSVLRAAACGLITVLAIGTGRRRSLVPALAAAVLLLVLHNPWLARDIGFLLSVLATGALLTVAPRWSEALRRRGVPGRLAEVLAAAAAAQAACAPVVAVLAAHVSLVAIPCNLLAEFAVAPATVLGFAALAVATVVMPLAKALAWLAGWPAGWLAATARTGAALPGATIGWPGRWGGALLLAGLIVLLVPVARRVLRRPWLCAVCALTLLLAVARPAPVTRVITGWPPPGWQVAMCDVGQGDALVLAAGEGAAVVVDTGPDPQSVDRCLRDLGITVIPLVVLTHFHADHVAGLTGVLRGRTVGAIQGTTVQEPLDQARFVHRRAQEAGIAVISSVPGERRRLGSLSWEVLWPPSTGPPSSGLGANDASVTLLVRAAGLTVLLPGDLEPAAQRRLLISRPDLPRVDVLKVAHHGCALLSRFRVEQ